MFVFWFHGSLNGCVFSYRSPGGRCANKKQFFMIHLKLGNIIIFLYVFNISRLDIVVIDEISLLELIVWVLE